MIRPFIIGTRNAGTFLHAGAAILKEGGSALDAVEASTRLVEDNPGDTSVGTGGIPNLLGVQEMDASIMCGETLRAGAVGYVGWNGVMDTAIAIRTAVVKDGMLHVQAGAGIVADSDPESEWQETLSKCRAVFRAAELAANGLGTLR